MKRYLTIVALAVVSQAACGSGINVMRANAGYNDVAAAESYLRDLTELVRDEPIQVRWKDFLVISSGPRNVAVVPFTGAVRSGQRDLIQRCQLLIMESSERRIVERPNSGFSDDYEPCESIELKSLVDINSDGIIDLVYEVMMVDATGRVYSLLDTYLVMEGGEICLSASASVRLMSKYWNPKTKPPLSGDVLRTDRLLQQLRCGSL